MTRVVTRLKRFWKMLRENRTRTFGFLQGLVAVFAGMTDLFPSTTLKWLLVANALLTYLLGQFNSWETKTAPPPPPSEQP